MKNITILLLLINSLSAFGQNEIPPPPSEEVMEEELPVFEDVEIMEDVDILEEPVFIDAEIYDSGMVVKFDKSEYYYNDKIGKDRVVAGVDLFYEKYSDTYPKKYGLLKNGSVLLPMLFMKHGYSYGDAPIVLGIGNTVGLFNYNIEKWDIPLIYESLTKLNDNMYVARLDGKYGVIDDKNNVIVEFEWSAINGISGVDNYIKVANNDYPTKFYGIFNIPQKKLTIPCRYSQISEIENASYFKVVDGVKHNIVDINNKPRFKKWYDELNIPSGGRKFYIVKLNGKVGVIDEMEKEVVPIEYYEIKTYPYNDGSHLAKNKDGKYGCIMLDGRVTLPFVYDNLNTSYGNNVVAMKNNKCGIVQVNSGLPYEITTCDYDSIVGHSNVFMVEKNNKFGLLDLYGKLVVPIEYDHIESTSNNYYDKKNIFIATKKEKNYLINNSGEVLNTKPYIEIQKLASVDPNGYYSNSVKYDYLLFKSENGKFGIIDKFGSEVLEAKFDEILKESKNVIIVKHKGMVGLYNLFSKTQLVPCEYDQIMIDKMGFIGMKGNDFYHFNSQGKVTKIE